MKINIAKIVAMGRNRLPRSGEKVPLALALKYFSEKRLSDHFRLLVQSYVPELQRAPGIHAIRHIRATHEIVTTGDYVHAAYLLHDDTKTVLDNYAHTLNAYHERQRALRGTTSALSGLSDRAALKRAA
jgi:hypothetical protein